jgi:hypothetical protein
LLQGPGVAVGVAERDERAPRLHIDVAGLNTLGEELLAGGLGVGHHALHDLCEPGGIVVIPVPSTMEQADPGGVSCTNRNASFTW